MFGLQNFMRVMNFRLSVRFEGVPVIKKTLKDEIPSAISVVHAEWPNALNRSVY